MSAKRVTDREKGEGLLNNQSSQLIIV